MQTFLPFPDFDQTFECLDYRRLGKQRVEASQIYNILKGKQKSKGWVNHPAVKMWRGHERALALYRNLAIEHWKARGYNNTMRRIPIRGKIIMPPWMGRSDFHAAHRANLLRKDPEHYGQFGWKESPDLPYVWPVEE